MFENAFIGSIKRNLEKSYFYVVWIIILLRIKISSAYENAFKNNIFSFIICLIWLLFNLQFWSHILSYFFNIKGFKSLVKEIMMIYGN